MERLGENGKIEKIEKIEKIGKISKLVMFAKLEPKKVGRWRDWKD